MKVLHTIASLGAKSGGTSTATFDLLSALNKLELPGRDCVNLLASGVADENNDRSLAAGCRWYKEVPYDCETPYLYSRNISRFLRANPYDVYHTNGMWLHVNHKTCATARLFGKPYVITPHGMLYPEALKRSAWKKWPLRKLYFDKDIRKASCIHATCEAEMRHIRDLGYCGPIAIIGNPVICPTVTENLLTQRKPFKADNTITIGFLGRLHPIKAVEKIIQAIALKPKLNIQLRIIGSGDRGYETFLKSESERLGVKEKIQFLGFITGDEKFRQLAGLDALFVPSDMENFGMIIPEALLVGTPVMASLGTPWESLNTERCGWWVDNSPESIAKVIDKITQSSSEQLREMGLRGRDLVLSRFESSKVASSMYRLYKWLNGEAPKPEFVSDGN